MKKLILSSVFAGLVAIAPSVQAEAAKEKSGYGKFVVKADVAAGYWANVYHQNDGTNTEDTIDSDDFGQRHLVALADANFKFMVEGGCSSVAFGSVLKIEANPAKMENGKHAEIFRDTYVYGRFGNMIEVRAGLMRDALWAFETVEDIQLGSQGYDGYYGALLGGTNLRNTARKDQWMLSLRHANDTGYTNALEVRTTRMAGFQALVNFKPSAAYKGRLDTFGDGMKTLSERNTNNPVWNNILSVGASYDNKFGDWRVRADAAFAYGLTKPKDKDRREITEFQDSFTYQAGLRLTWKDLDFGVGWLDNRSTGSKVQDYNSGKAVHGGVGYQLSSVMWKPAFSVGVMYGWKGGSNADGDANKLANQDQTLTFTAAAELNIRDGFRWFVEGAFAMIDEKNSPLKSDQDFGERNLILGTGLAVSQ